MAEVDNTTRIADIDAILDAGVTEVETDEVRTKWDLAALRRRRAELVEEDTTLVSKRPRAARILLNF